MSGMPTPVEPLDITNRRHSEHIIAAASSIRTRRSPSSFAAICLIDSIQREHAAQLAHRRAELMAPWPGEDDAPDRHPRA